MENGILIPQNIELYNTTRTHALARAVLPKGEEEGLRGEGCRVVRWPVSNQPLQEIIMTKPNFYGLRSKDVLTLAQTETNTTRLTQMHEFYTARIAKFKAEGRDVKAKRWERVVAVLAQRIAGGSATPNLANAVTFTTAKNTGAAKKSRAKAGAKSVGFDLDNLTDAQASELFTQLALRMNK